MWCWDDEGGGNLLRLRKTTSNYFDAGGLESEFLWTLDLRGMITHIYRRIKMMIMMTHTKTHIHIICIHPAFFVAQ